MDARSPPYLADSDNVGQRPEWGGRLLGVYGLPRAAIKTTEPVMISELEFTRRG